MPARPAAATGWTSIALTPPGETVAGMNHTPHPRSPVRRLLATVAVAVAAVLVAPAAPAAAYDAGSVEAEMFSLLNEERLRHEDGNREALVYDDAMATIAREWSAQMASNGDISHNPNQDDLPPPWLQLGENVDVFMGDTAQAAFDRYFNSRPHRVNMLRREWDTVGIGVHQSDDGQLWTTMFFAAGRQGGSEPTDEIEGGTNIGGAPEERPEDDGPALPGDPGPLDDPEPPSETVEDATDGDPDPVPKEPEPIVKDDLPETGGPMVWWGVFGFALALTGGGFMLRRSGMASSR